MLDGTVDHSAVRHLQLPLLGGISVSSDFSLCGLHVVILRLKVWLTPLNLAKSCAAGAVTLSYSECHEQVYRHTPIPVLDFFLPSLSFTFVILTDRQDEKKKNKENVSLYFSH